MDRDVLPEGYELHWYKVQSLLGRGAFGVTYLALDQNLDQLVAIKEYFPAEYSSRVTGHTVHPITGEQGDMYAWGLDRFIKEARILAKFKHHNIVRVLSVFEQNNSAYMVMEYERGQELAALYKKEGPLSEQRLLSIYLPILSGLSLIHKAGFIHRDIKPSNIYIRKSDGSPVLIDFGAARKVAGAQTRSLTSLVTQGYAPFEQFNEGDEKQGPWTDIYALGACLFFAVTGQLPRDALARGSSLLSTGVDSYETAASLAVAEYSARLLRAIDAALKFHAQDRPQSVEAWADMLCGKANSLEVPNPQDVYVDDDEDATIIVPHQPSSRVVSAPVSEISEEQVAIAKQETKINKEVLSRVLANRKPLLWLGGAGAALVVLISLFAIFSGNEPEQLATATKTVATSTQPDINPTTKLLESAALAYSSGNILEPPKKNALYLYKQVLQLDPNHSAAKNAVEKILNLNSDGVRSDIEAGYLDHAEKKVKQLQSILGDSERVLALQNEVNAAIAQKQNIDNLLAQANNFMSAGKRVKPESENALDRYRKILALVPNHPEAQAGIDKIVRYYTAKAKEDIDHNLLKNAEQNMDVVRVIAPQSQALLDLDKRLSKIQQEKNSLAKLIDHANKALNAGDLLQPYQENALYYYNLALKQDSDNKSARRGIAQIQTKLKDKFATYVASDDLHSAETLVKSVESSFPKTRFALDLRSRLSRSYVERDSDMETVGKLMEQFKQSFKARDTRALRDISVFQPGVENFLTSFFDNYPSFQLDLSNIKLIKDKRSGSAKVQISQLVNKQGSRVKPGAWGEFYITAHRNKKGHWKIFWSDSNGKKDQASTN